MTYAEALRQIDDLLQDERRALVAVKLDAVVALGSRKAALLRAVEDGLAPDEPPTPETLDLARRVKEGAERNWFLIRHLRGCLTVVGGDRAAQPTYGRRGLPEAAPTAGLTRARL